MDGYPNPLPIHVGLHIRLYNPRKNMLSSPA